MFDLIIVGAGPAGMSAAVYASRGELKVCIIEKEVPGGKVVKTSDIENYPGFPTIQGPDLAYQMFAQVQKFGAEYVYGEVTEIIDQGTTKKVVCADGEVYEGYAVIIATGSVERKLGIPGEGPYYGKGVSYCAVCDGALYKDKPMAVIGGGNSALDEALYLTRFSKKVYLIHRRQEFRGDFSTVELIKKNRRIELILDTVPVEILGDDVVKQIVLENVVTKERQTLDVSVVFPFIGSLPENKAVRNFDIKDTNGYILTNKNMETTVPGIFAAGDITSKDFRQIVTATNDGAIAANKAIAYIDEIKRKVA